MYAAHSALGVVAGLLLFASMATGIPALFIHELGAWQNPRLRYDAPREIDLDAVVTHGLASAPAGTEEIRLFLPTPAHPAVQFLFSQRGANTWLDVHPASLEDLAHGEHGFLWVWGRVHTNLLLGRTGRYVVGFSGLVLLFLVTSGLLAHRKLLREPFTWRRHRSLRVSLGDLHKLLGAWLSPMHVMFALTGSILGLLGILTLVNALVAYGGDQDAAFRAVLGPFVERAGTPSDPVNVQPFLERARREFPHIRWHSMALLAWNDTNAHIELEGEHTDTIAMASSVRYRVSDNALVHRVEWVGEGVWRRAFSFVMPLHFAEYGGLIVKLLYALAGLGGALLAASGLLVWIVKRDAPRFTRIVMGFVGGLPLATFVTPLVDRTLAMQLASRDTLVPSAYVLALAVAIAFAFTRPPERALRELLHGAAAIACTLAVVDIVLTGASAMRAANGGFVMSAILLVAITPRGLALHSRRPRPR